MVLILGTVEKVYRNISLSILNAPVANAIALRYHPIFTHQLCKIE